MQTILADRPGPVSVLQLLDRPVPSPGHGQLVIRVASASVNFSDVMRRRGDPYPIPTRFPYTPGSEISGTVESIGPDVDPAMCGQTVFALAGADGSGGYAQFALASAESAMPVPPGLTTDLACALVVAGVTPMLMLTEAAPIRRGDWVLVQAGGGAVGSFAIQIAKSMGAQVIACGSTVEKRHRALDLGADHVIDVSREHWSQAVHDATSGRGVDVALESGGEETFAQTVASLAAFGTLVVYGFASGRPLRFTSEIIEHMFYSPSPNQTIRAFNLAGYAFGRRAAFGAAMERLVRLVMEGTIRLDIECLPLANAAEAHRRLEERESLGKIVLKPWE